VGNQPMDLLLKLTVDFVKHVEAEKVIANDNFVSVAKQCLSYQLTIHQSAIRGSKIRDFVNALMGVSIHFTFNARVKSRGARIVQSYVSLERTSYGHPIPFEWDRYGH
jgi:hypothetical protein